MNPFKPPSSIFAETLPRGYEHTPVEALIVFSVALLIGFAVYRFLRRGAERFHHDASGHQSRFIEAMRAPMLMWILLVALLAGLRDLNTRSLPPLLLSLLSYSLLALIVVSFTMAAARLTILVMSAYFLKRGQPLTTLTITLVRMVWTVPGVLLVMNLFGISLAPVLTALGVGGLAVALGLRDTLSNLFAGFYVILAGQFDQGDYVKLSSGPEGYVTDILWRMTSLQTLDNHIVLIPNSKIAEAIVTNFSKPARLLSITLPVRVALGSDIEKVEKLLLEAAVEVSAGNPDLLKTPPPSVAFSGGFIESGLEISLYVNVPEYQKQYAVLDQLRRAVLKRFRAEGIEFAMPLRRVVNEPGTPPAPAEAR